MAVRSWCHARRGSLSATRSRRAVSSSIWASIGCGACRVRWGWARWRIQAFPGGSLRYGCPIRPDRTFRCSSSFVGREAELESLEKLLAEARLLTLTGSGGCGKTRLGLELARRVSASEDRGACFVDLAPVSDARAVPSAIAGALGLRDDGRPTLDQIVDYLQDRDMVLVVDNCEHVIAAAADAVGALLTACATVTVIATSREPLGVGGETPWRVPRLSVPERGRPEPRGAARVRGGAALRRPRRQGEPQLQGQRRERTGHRGGV